MNETIQQKVTPSCVSAPAPRKVYVIGHKNPDTDSICSAIAYADIKRRTEEGIFEAKRAGQISQETQYVLDRFQVDPPGYVPNVAPRVKDMEVRRIPGVSDHISLKKAWNLMRTQNVNTLPIVQEGNTLEGLITISDIAKSYMDVYDNAILSTARTQYKNILETLDGTMVVGNEHAYFVKGKVVIAAANPDLMENYIEEDDLVILGNAVVILLDRIGDGVLVGKGRGVDVDGLGTCEVDVAKQLQIVLIRAVRDRRGHVVIIKPVVLLARQRRDSGRFFERQVERHGELIACHVR